MVGRGGWGPREKVERPADKAVRRANARRIGRLFRGYWGKLSIVTVLIRNRPVKRCTESVTFSARAAAVQRIL